MKYKILDYGHDGIIVYPGILNDDKNINNLRNELLNN